MPPARKWPAACPHPGRRTAIRGLADRGRTPAPVRTLARVRPRGRPLEPPRRPCRKTYVPQTIADAFPAIAASSDATDPTAAWRLHRRATTPRRQTLHLV